MNLASEKQPLASEIIADQAAEVKKLKAELQEAEELRDIYDTQTSVCQMQLDIVNLLHIYIPRKRYRLYMELRKVLIRTSSKKNRRERTNGKMRFNSSSLPKSYHGSGSEQQKQKIITAHL